MNEFPDIHVDIDSHAINQSVHRAMEEAMEGMGEAFQFLNDLPFAIGHGWPERPERPHEERHREFRERRDMRDALKALERGEITVDEAMERLDQRSD